MDIGNSTRKLHNNSNRTHPLILTIMILGTITFAGYGIVNLFFLHRQVMGYASLISSGILLAATLYYSFTGNTKTSTLGCILSCMALFAILLADGGRNDMGLTVTLLIPLIGFYTQGMRRGLLLSLLYTVYIWALALISILKILPLAHTPTEYLELSYVFLLVIGMTYLYESVSLKKEKEINRQIYFNTLTGLPNRNQLLQDLSKQTGVTLMLINVDDFKEINDLYGGTTGDNTLREIASRLLELKNHIDIICIYRLPADEFAILCRPHITAEEVIQLAKNIHTLLSENFLIDSIDIALTVSIGISSSERDLLADTDIALKTAKEKRLSHVYFDPSMKVAEKYKHNIQQLHTLRHAVLFDNIVPYFQPIYCNSTNKITKYECLVRMETEGNTVSPYYFLDLARRARLYPKITQTMIKKSFSFFKERPEDFSINICLDDIINSKTTDLICKSLDEFPDPGRVVFELLESDKIEDFPEVKQFVESVKMRGCRIAIDDFGSGYSNFEYVLRMNVDYLKIDASLIRNICNDRNSLIVTDTIVDFSKKLNIQTIAEFVSSREIFTKVSDLGIDFAQGYYIGEPKPSVSPENQS